MPARPHPSVTLESHFYNLEVNDDQLRVPPGCPPNSRVDLSFAQSKSRTTLPAFRISVADPTSHYNAPSTTLSYIPQNQQSCGLITKEVYSKSGIVIASNNCTTSDMQDRLPAARTTKILPTRSAVRIHVTLIRLF